MVKSILLQCAAIALTALLLQACGRAPRSQVTTGLAGLDAVAGLDVYADGSTIHLLLVGSVNEQNVVRYLQSTDGGAHWSAPVAVSSGGKPPYGVHRGDDARVAASGKRLVAVWPTEGTGWGGSGPMASAISDDGGYTWRPGPDPAGPGTMSEAFMDIVADGNGVFHIVWLDSQTGRQGLHYARSTDGGRHWSPNQTIDPTTCECCWNTLRLAPGGGLYVLYRDAGPRDMALAVSSDGGGSWQRAGTVGAFDWNVDLCPHTGGGLVVTHDGKQPVLHALVWTGKQGRLGLHYAISKDGGKSWRQWRRLGDASARHNDMAALDGERLAVVWDAATSKGSAIFIVRSDDGGGTWSAPRQLSAPGAQATHPRIVATSDGYCVFWTRADGQWAVVRFD